MVLSALLASSSNASRALCLLVVDDYVWVDVRSRNNICGYLLYLLELLLTHVLMVRLRDHLMASVGCSATHWNHCLTTLVKLVLLLLHWLRIIGTVAVHDSRLRIIVGKILHIAMVVGVLVQRLFGGDPTTHNFEWQERFDLLLGLLLQRVLVLQVDLRWHLRPIDSSGIFD